MNPIQPQSKLITHLRYATPKDMLDAVYTTLKTYNSTLVTILASSDLSRPTRTKFPTASLTSFHLKPN